MTSTFVLKKINKLTLIKGRPLTPPWLFYGITWWYELTDNINNLKNFTQSINQSDVNINNKMLINTF